MQQTLERRAWTIREVAQQLGIPIRTAYHAAQVGEIRAVRIGGRVLVPVDEIDRLLEQPPAPRGPAGAR